MPSCVLMPICRNLSMNMSGIVANLFTIFSRAGSAPSAVTDRLNFTKWMQGKMTETGRLVRLLQEQFNFSNSASLTWWHISIKPERIEDEESAWVSRWIRNSRTVLQPTATWGTKVKRAFTVIRGKMRQYKHKNCLQWYYSSTTTPVFILTFTVSKQLSIVYRTDYYSDSVHGAEFQTITFIVYGADYYSNYP